MDHTPKRSSSSSFNESNLKIENRFSFSRKSVHQSFFLLLYVDSLDSFMIDSFQFFQKTKKGNHVILSFYSWILNSKFKWMNNVHSQMDNYIWILPQVIITRFFFFFGFIAGHLLKRFIFWWWKMINEKPEKRTRKSIPKR